MKVSDCFYFGYVSKTIGNNGELALKLDVDSPISYIDIEAFFLQTTPNQEQLIPFFIESTQLLNNGQLRCAIEGINNAQESKILVGKSIFLPLNLLPELNDDQFYFHEIIGFTVIDEKKGDIGLVDKVIEYPHSNLLSIVVNEKEVLIPINDETIVKVNKKERALKVNSPEGLIELYLED